MKLVKPGLMRQEKESHQMMGQQIISPTDGWAVIGEGRRIMGAADEAPTDDGSVDDGPPDPSFCLVVAATLTVT